MNEDWIYYRIILSSREGRFVISELQDFDEYDYDHSRYLTNRKFHTKEDALKFCQKAYRNPRVPDYIKDLLKPLIQSSYNIDKYME